MLNIVVVYAIPILASLYVNMRTTDMDMEGEELLWLSNLRFLLVSLLNLKFNLLCLLLLLQLKLILRQLVRRRIRENNKDEHRDIEYINVVAVVFFS